MSNYKTYVNKQGDTMLNIPYNESILYKSVLATNDIWQLQNHLRYSEIAVDHWTKLEDEIQVVFFQADVNHIKAKIAKLSQKNNSRSKTEKN